MADRLAERLRAALDGVTAPDLWSEATSPGRPDRPEPRPTIGRRVIVSVVSFALFVGAVGLVVIGRFPKEGPTPASPTAISSTLRIHDGSLLCTATTDPTLSPGQSIPLTVTITNEGSSAAHVPSFSGADATVKDANGTVLWDSGMARGMALGPGPDLGMDLEAGASHAYDLSGDRKSVV